MKTSKDTVCGKCGAPTIMVEYGYDSKYRYDGISEIACVHAVGPAQTCDWRIGRWCEKELQKNEIEPPYCEGGHHPRIISLED